MKEPLFVRSLTNSEHTSLRTGLRSALAFTLRRSQLLLLSAEGKTPRQIARHLGCTDQTVRNVIRAFATEGLDCLEQKSSRPKTTKPELDEAKCEQIRALLHYSPRQFGKARSTWSLPLGAEVCQERGLTKSLVSDETIRNAIKRLGISWKRARNWSTSPDPAYARKKRRGTA
jgi:transposase